MKMALRVAARHSRRDGQITPEQYAAVMDAIRHPERKKLDGTPINLIDAVEEYTTQQMGVQGKFIDWQGVIQWFKDHWPQIIQTLCSLLSLCILFADEPKKR
jgi:hypothetical protein